MGEQIEASILFSDIRDFTEYTHQRGDQRAFDLLQIHNEIVASHIKAHEGKLVKTFGDGMMVRFDRSTQAVAAAIDIQRAFNAHTQDHPQEPILVGMGLHKGLVICEKDDLFGHAVNLAKRLSDEARCCQIIVSKVITEDLRSIPEPFDWLDLGEREIKGVGKERLYEIVWRSEAARLTTTDNRYNLVLTEDGKLVIELGKLVQSRLDEVQARLRDKAETRSGLARWVLKKLERWIPQWIDRALLRAGVGIEHDVDQVEMRFLQGKLLIQIGSKPRLMLQASEIDPAEVQQFLQIVQSKRESLTSRPTSST